MSGKGKCVKKTGAKIKASNKGHKFASIPGGSAPKVTPAGALPIASKFDGRSVGSFVTNKPIPIYHAYSTAQDKGRHLHGIDVNHDPNNKNKIPNAGSREYIAWNTGTGPWKKPRYVIIFIII